MSSGSTDLRLWVLRANEAGRAFYEARGWLPDGTTRTEDLGSFAFEESRYRADSRLLGGDF